MELNLKKTRIEYCKDDDHKVNHENTSFDFLDISSDQIWEVHHELSVGNQ